MKQFIPCERRKRDLLHFLLVQTSLVRSCVKPAEILAVDRCPCPQTTGHTQAAICMGQREVLEKIGLPYRILQLREIRSLVMFYDPDLLWETLAKPYTMEYLRRHGYTDCVRLEDFLERLTRHFENGAFAHEVGLFLGYPLKDVVGFIANRAQITYQGSWRVYGKPEPSLQLMERFRRARALAEVIVNQVEDWDACVEKLSQIRFFI